MQYKRYTVVKNIKRFSAGLLLVCLLISVISCGRDRNEDTVQSVSDMSVPEKLDIPELEAQDTAVFLEYKERLGEIRLMSADNGRSYTVSINNLTTFEDNYGKVSVPQLFETGMIVDADISVHSKTLKSLKQDPDAYVRRDVTGFDINLSRGIFSLSDGTNLHITENTLVIKDGKDIRISDISDDDVLLLRGIGSDLYSICLMSGYGHLRIKGAEYFTGGWVQIAGIYKPVSDDMLLDVPEGEYDMVVSYKGRGGTKHVVILRGKETSADVSDLKGDLVKTGEIIFTIKPLDAEPVVKIDGKTVNYLEPVALEYGVYQLEIAAEGYATVKEHVAVGSEVANIEIELTKNETEKTVSSNRKPATVSKNSPPTALSENTAAPYITGTSSTSSTTVSSSGSSSSASGAGSGSSIVQGSRIYIDAPETAEVYFDGIYKGIVPCSFIKESGTHVITLRKDGYETRTFTVTLDNSSQNETYSFSALQEK